MNDRSFRIKGSSWAPSSGERGDGLIMSATLVPPPAAVARAEPADRLNDYLEALRFYLELPSTVIDRILFVDNSDSDITPLIGLAKHLNHDKEVELVSFAGNDHPYQLGKAYGEFKLMDYGLANTALFAPDDLVWKTTGRLRFLNLPEVSRRCRRLSFDVLCDLHNVPWVGSRRWRHYQHMELRVFAFRVRAYDALMRGLWRTHETGFDGETMYHLMREAHRGYRVIPRFPVQPQLQGISGRHQRDYRSTSQRSRDAVRSLVRRVAPWLWL
jgi:hypothetical protein